MPRLLWLLPWRMLLRPRRLLPLPFLPLSRRLLLRLRLLRCSLPIRREIRRTAVGLIPGAGAVAGIAADLSLAITADPTAGSLQHLRLRLLRLRRLPRSLIRLKSCRVNLWRNIGTLILGMNPPET